jgi:hypothetical protein
MKLGFNSNIEVGGVVYHVQTEDRGLNHPFVDTVVLSGGRVVHRRSASYQDLLSGEAVDQTALSERVERQHREVADALRSGLLVFEEPRPSALAVRLCNPTAWLLDGHAALEIEVLTTPEKRPVSGVEVVASIERGNGVEPPKFASQTGADGRALLRFRMPDLGDDENPSLVIGLAGGGTEASLRYRLKAKPSAEAPPDP